MGKQVREPEPDHSLPWKCIRCGAENVSGQDSCIACGVSYGQSEIERAEQREEKARESTGEAKKKPGGWLWSLETDDDATPSQSDWDIGY